MDDSSSHHRSGDTICDTDVELTFKLDESTFQTVSNIPTLNSSCSEVGLGHTFTISEIEAYLKSKFGINCRILSKEEEATYTAKAFRYTSINHYNGKNLVDNHQNKKIIFTKGFIKSL